MWYFYRIHTYTAISKMANTRGTAAAAIKPGASPEAALSGTVEAVSVSVAEAAAVASSVWVVVAVTDAVTAVVVTVAVAELSPAALSYCFTTKSATLSPYSST